MNIEEMSVYLLSPVAQVALIIGLAELVKKAGLNARFIPIVDVVLGLVSGIAVYGWYLGYGYINGTLIGLALGLSACGLFSGIKNLTKTNTEEK